LSLPIEFLDKRAIVIALAGSNGAGKSTFYESILADSGLRFINADVFVGIIECERLRSSRDSLVLTLGARRTT
jgi:predicted ABC-type ATPase